MATVMVKFYRYESSPAGAYIVAFPVVRTTPCGTFIDVYGYPKFVRRDARKHFACPTKEDALVSFIARKHRQIKILEAQLNAAKHSLASVSESDSECVWLR